MISIPYVLSGISIILLVIYGIDILVKMTLEFELLPDPTIRGIGFGIPAIILSFVAFFMSKKLPFKGLGIMLIITGIMIIIGGIIILPNTNETEHYSRWLVSGGVLITVGAIITALGGIKIKNALSLK